jgi:hypothetical protein
LVSHHVAIRALYGVTDFFSVNIFIFAAIASLVVAALHVQWWMIMALSGIMLIPVLWYISVALWLPRGFKEKIYYLFGLFIYITCGPVLNLTVLFYALWNLDSFGWGKTRQVIACDDDEKVGIDSESDEDDDTNAAFHISRRNSHISIASRRTSQRISHNTSQLKSQQTSNRTSQQLFSNQTSNRTSQQLTSHRTSNRTSQQPSSRTSKRQSQMSELQIYYPANGNVEMFERAHVRDHSLV